MQKSGKNKQLIGTGSDKDRGAIMADGETIRDNARLPNTAKMTAPLMPMYCHMAGVSSPSPSNLSTQCDRSKFCPNCNPLYEM